MGHIPPPFPDAPCPKPMHRLDGPICSQCGQLLPEVKKPPKLRPYLQKTIGFFIGLFFTYK